MYETRGFKHCSRNCIIITSFRTSDDVYQEPFVYRVVGCYENSYFCDFLLVRRYQVLFEHENAFTIRLLQRAWIPSTKLPLDLISQEENSKRCCLEIVFISILLYFLPQTKFTDSSVVSICTGGSLP